MEIHTCPLCKSQHSLLVWKGVRKNFSLIGPVNCTTSQRKLPTVHKCLHCSHHYIPAAEQIPNIEDQYLTVEDHEYLTLWDVKKRTFSRALKLVQKHQPPPARLLEIGSYAGVFLELAAQVGYAVQGIEPSKWGTEIATSLGLPVLNGRLEEVQSLIHDRFEIVVAWDVLEHVVDPRLFLASAVNFLKPNGLLIFSTLDRNNWFAKFLGKRWPWIINMHLHYFSQSDLKTLCKDLGLSLLETGPHIHFARGEYALARLLRRSNNEFSPIWQKIFSKIIIRVGFGDVRYFVFRLGTPSS